MNSPKISICIPAYEQPACLRRTLHSIKIQSFTNYEIILTDDSPDDSVKDLVSEFDFAGKLNYFKNAVRLGSPENWNEAVRHACGEYIKIIHHDDWFTSSNSLSRYAQMLDDHPESDFAFSATSIFHSKEETYSVNSPAADKLEQLRHDRALLYFGNFIGAPSATLYRRNAGIAYDRNIKYVVDVDFYIRMLKQNPRFQYCSQTLICTTSGARHQVTDECMHKEAQLFEYTYLYNKIRTGLIPEARFGNFFYSLFNQFNVKSLKEFRAAGILLPKPVFYFQWILFKKNMFQFCRSVTKTIGDSNPPAAHL